MTLTATLKQRYLEQSPAAAAKLLERLHAEELKQELLDVPVDALLPSLDRLTSSRASLVFDLLERDKQLEVLGKARPRLAVVLVANLERAHREELFESLDKVTRDELRRILSYPEDTAGRLMDAAVDATLGMNLQQIKERMQEAGVQRARSVYVVDEENRLLGRVDMQDLALAEPGWLISDFIHESKSAVSAIAPRDEIIAFLNATRLDSVPVVDSDQRLLGVVRYQKIFEAIESSANADLQKMVGGSADEKSLSSPGFAIKRRLPWLHINLLTAFMAASVVGLFENLIAQFTALAVLLPVVAGQSGNAGSQALAVTIRGIALKEIGTREWQLVLKKECVIGLVNGLALALSCGVGVYLWSSSFGLALVIAVAMVLSMVAAGISGALVPIVLTRAGQDPATASSIILTTVTDIAGFFAFLGTATLLASML